MTRYRVKQEGSSRWQVQHREWWWPFWRDVSYAGCNERQVAIDIATILAHPEIINIP